MVDPAGTVRVRLNQQQLELIDRTVAKGVAADRVALIRLALKEYAMRHDRKDLKKDPAP